MSASKTLPGPPEHSALLCVTEDCVPWQPCSPGFDLVSAKRLFTHPSQGESVGVLRAPPGVELPCLSASGTAYIYTLQGRWRYPGYDWVAGPGSVVVQLDHASRSPQTLEDGTEDVILLVVSVREQAGDAAVAR